MSAIPNLRSRALTSVGLHNVWQICAAYELRDIRMASDFITRPTHTSFGNLMIIVKIQFALV